MASRTQLTVAKQVDGGSDVHKLNKGAEFQRRLVVELGRQAAGDLAWLVEETEVNKTTVVNRAVQVYRLLIEAQNNGGSIMISDPTRGDSTMYIVT